MKAVVNIIGIDKPGIIAKFATGLYECNANILDISQTVLREEFFVMTMLADIEHITVSFEDMKNKIEQIGKELGMEAKIQREEIFKSMHRI